VSRLCETTGSRTPPTQSGPQTMGIPETVGLMIQRVSVEPDQRPFAHPDERGDPVQTMRMDVTGMWPQRLAACHHLPQREVDTASVPVAEPARVKHLTRRIPRLPRMASFQIGLDFAGTRRSARDRERRYQCMRSPTRSAPDPKNRDAFTVQVLPVGTVPTELPDGLARPACRMLDQLGPLCFNIRKTVDVQADIRYDDGLGLSRERWQAPT
jgi:hypothetical protein